ncbi:hypothetical protein Hanom_Chr14g01283351 [Helianthus anomalus]
MSCTLSFGCFPKKNWICDIHVPNTAYLSFFPKTLHHLIFLPKPFLLSLSTKRSYRNVHHCRRTRRGIKVTPFSSPANPLLYHMTTTVPRVSPENTTGRCCATESFSKPQFHSIHHR